MKECLGRIVCVCACVCVCVCVCVGTYMHMPNQLIAEVALMSMCMCIYVICAYTHKYMHTYSQIQNRIHAEVP